MTAHAPVISSWSAVSAFGVGRNAFVAGMRAGAPSRTPIDPESYPSLPVNEARLVPASGPQELLGRKGTRSMDRATALAVSAVGQLLVDDGNTLASRFDEDAGIVLGTSTGSINSIMSFIRDALTQDKPYLVDPARFPNTVMNCAASRSAIWHRLRGPNVTIAGGRAAALLALNHARRLQQSGRANCVVCGSVEEFSAERAWLAWHTRADEQESMLLGEGAAVVLLEKAQTSVRPALADVLAVEVGLAADVAEVGAVLTDCLKRAADQVAGAWDTLWAVAPSTPPGQLGREEREALERVLGDRDRLELCCTDWLGDTYSASGAFQIAALLAEAQRRPEAVGRLALVTAVDRDGLVAVSLLRIAAGALS
jgi:3-oxoacyl-[acyl-carrier-protein] synthase II